MNALKDVMNLQTVSSDTVQFFMVRPPNAHLDAHWKAGAAVFVHPPGRFYSLSAAARATLAVRAAWGGKC
jgi:hypothetical protein